MNEQMILWSKTRQLFEEDEIQLTQLQHRFRLVEAFEIKEGMRVLEIGCGQGDTTVALAEAVGEHGEVVALDIAKGDYGAPQTLQQAHDVINRSVLGTRIKFHLETDFLQFEDPGTFDAIVLSHCSWYFRSKEQLMQYFEKMSSMTNHICFAEWNLSYTDTAQRSHFCAVQLLALYSAFIDNDGNIQNIYSEMQVIDMAKRAGLSILHQRIIDATYLQDASWEVGYANTILPELANAPEAISVMATSLAETMNASKEQKSLNSFVLVFSN